MSLLSRRPASFAAPEPEAPATVAPLEPLASVPVVEEAPTEAPNLTEAAALALAAASADFTAAQAAVAKAREALEATTPASFATADAYVSALDRARFAVAKAAESANYAVAKKETAKAQADALARKELESAAESCHWGCEWAGRALIAAVQHTPEGFPVRGLSAAVTLCREAVFARSELLDELTAAAPRIMPTRAKPDSVAADLAGILNTREEGLAATYAVALACAKWLATRPAREAERREMDRRRDHERARHQAMEDASGRNGHEAQARAIAAEMTGIRAMSQPRMPSLASEPAEVAAYAANAKMSGQL